MKFVHRTLPSFWDCYEQLPVDLQDRADKQFELMEVNPSHPSLQLKPVGVFWSARVTDSYRALAVREGPTFIWFWLGTHAEYERVLQG